jgi:dihydrofolate reductase
MNFIVAVDEQWNIGRDGALLQPIPEDLKSFKKMTLNKIVVLGRKTLKTFPGAKPLKGRTNIILTRQEGFSAEEAIICNSYEQLFQLLHKYCSDDIFVIGGGEIYNKLIPYCDTAYVTKIHNTYHADTSIMDLDKEPNWKLTKSDGKHHFKDNIYYSFLEYHNSEVLPMP